MSQTARVKRPQDRRVKKPSGKAHGRSHGTSHALLEEIVALGGTPEDLTLVEGVDVDTEDEDIVGLPVDDKKLESDVRRYLKGLDVKPVAPADDAVAERPAKRQRVEPPAQINGSAKGNIESPRPVETNAVPREHTWLVEPASAWYAIDLPPLPERKPSTALAAERKTQLRTRAERILDQLGQQYTAALSPTSGSTAMRVPLSRSDKVFLSNVLSSGTSSDRLSALILVTTSSPLHSSTYLHQLLTMCSKKSRDEALRALQTVSDWLRGSGGGLPDRKLKWFDDRDDDLNRVLAVQKDPKSPSRQRGDEWLAIWYFEDRFKRWYLDLLRILEALCKDSLPFVRMRALAHCLALLSAKPEQEHNLLILASSMLADNDRSVASKASHLILELLNEHSLMKAVVIREVAAVVHRPATDPKSVHGRYYGLITLNQMMLRNGDVDVADKLLDVYFRVFEDLLAEEEKKLSDKKGRRLPPTQHDVEADSKLLAAVLTGVNRAFPYAQKDDGIARRRLDTLYRITHTSTFSVSLQALTLLHRLTSATSPVGAASDRFYRILYDTLIDDRLRHGSKHAMYLDLLLRAIQGDPSDARQLAFAKRLLQSLPYHQPPYICGALRLLAVIRDVVPKLSSLLSQSEEQEDVDHFDDAPEEGTGVSSPHSEVAADVMSATRPSSSSYDPRKREPLHAGADKSCLWDLLPLLSHYHPSVRLFAREILEDSPSSNQSAMEDRTLPVFLDRFAYRGAKTKAPPPNEPVNVFSRAPSRVKTAAPVNAADFARKRVDNVSADQIFFHRFFTIKQSDEDAAAKMRDARRKRLSGADRGSISETADVHSEDDGSELDEDEIWSAMRASAKGAPGFDAAEADGDVDGELEDDDDEEEDAFDYTSDEGDAALDALVAAKGGNDGVTRKKTSVSSGDSEEQALFEDEEDDIIGSEEEVAIQAAPSAKEALQLHHKGKRGRDRRKLKSLPLFADAQEWEGLLGPDDDL